MFFVFYVLRVLRNSDDHQQRGRAILRVIENFAVTQSHSRSYVFTPLSKACVNCY